MKEPLPSSRPITAGVGVAVFVAVGMLAVFALSATGSAWATPDQSPLLATIPTPTPLAGAVDFDLYASSCTVPTETTGWFTARVCNYSSVEVTGPFTVVIKFGNVLGPDLPQVTPNPTKGTYSWSADHLTLTWVFTDLTPSECRYIYIHTYPRDATYQTPADATLTFSGGVMTDRALLNCDKPVEVPEASTLVLLGSGLAGLLGYARLRRRASRR